MQKHNKNKKFQRSHHVRISAVAIALATAFHVSGAVHLYQEDSHEKRLLVSSLRSFRVETERENETGRHMVRFDEGMRLPSNSGANV